MKFTEITEEQFRKFLIASPLKTFLQTPEIGKLRKSNGWTTYYVGIKKNNKIIAATMLLSKPEFKNRLEFYAPRGFLLDYHDKKVLEFFTKEIKKFIHEHNGYILRIDPYIVKQERDINGDIVDNGENNLDVIEYLKKLGFREKKNPEQVQWMFVLDLENKSEETILKEMKQNTRNLIKKAQKTGVKIRELKYEELEEFKKITDTTSKRIGFNDKPLSYYQDMYKLLCDNNEIKYMIAELDLNEYKLQLEKEIVDMKEKLETSTKEGRKKTLKINLESNQKKLEEANKLINEYGDKITLSGGMFICNCDEVIYLFSGNYIEFMPFNGQYLIQWEMISYAIKNGFKKYNFYGISGNFDRSSSEYGVYEFKKGFSGYVVELIGEFELPINKYYTRYKRNLAVKNIIKKLIKR